MSGINDTENKLTTDSIKNYTEVSNKITLQQLLDKKKRTPQDKHSIAVIYTIYHKMKDGKFKQHSTRYRKYLESTEEAYKRTFTLPKSSDWQKLNLAWITKPYRIVITNDGRKEKLKVYPTKEEQEDIDKTIIDVSIKHPFSSEYFTIATIRPAEELSISPTRDLYIRCPHNDVNITILCIEE